MKAIYYHVANSFSEEIILDLEFRVVSVVAYNNNSS